MNYSTIYGETNAGSMQLLDDDKVVLQDFDTLRQQIQQQDDRCKMLRWKLLVLGNVLVASLALLVCSTTWLLTTSYLVSTVAADVILLMILLTSSRAVSVLRYDLRHEVRVLSQYLAMLRETGPALLHVGKITVLKWEMTKIELSRYGI